MVTKAHYGTELMVPVAQWYQGAAVLYRDYGMRQNITVLDVHKLNKNTWGVGGCQQNLTLAYSRGH